MNKVSRNDPCPCGSGKKFKKCCGIKEGEAKKPRLGGTKLFSQGVGGGNGPSVNLARKVFKVLSAPAGVPKALSMPSTQDTPAEQSSCGYASLEELIGIEGAPKEPPKS